MLQKAKTGKILKIIKKIFGSLIKYFYLYIKIIN